MTGLEMAVLILSIALVLLQIVHELIAIYKPTPLSATKQ